MRAALFWRAAGYFLSVVPALAATVSFFPVLIGAGEGEKTVSLLACLFLALSLFPLWKTVRGMLRSPSAWQVYLLLFVFFFLTDRIAYEVMCISFVGCLSSVLGAVCFALARRAERKQREANT